MGMTWTRDDWGRLADSMLAGVRPFGSAGHARILLPGAPGGYGTEVDGLEGFARTFLLAAFRLAGEHGHDPDGLAEWYAAGLRAGTDPDSPDRWVRLDEHAQAKVEAASIAIALDLTRPWIWDRLDPAAQERVVEYLAPAVGDDTYPRINWVWFRLVVQTFLRSVGGPWSMAEMREDLATHDTFRRPGGWLADGDERSYDHYAGWALHTYPILWSRMAGASDLAAERRDRDVADLDLFLQDALHLVGADGSPLMQGRSLTYRFAAAAPFWAGVLAEVPSTSPALLRHAAAKVVGHFVEHDAFDEAGVLTLGWHGPWRQIAQAYSGPGSPYWAVKGLLGLVLPADHPVWAAPEEPLPIEQGDFVRAMTAPGWVASGTSADGVVRVANHGTDHGREGRPGGDSPLYARLGYSTATSPLLDQESWRSPLDQSVVLLDAEGRATHRTGMRLTTLQVEGTGPDTVGIAASAGSVHWLEPDDVQQHHGSGYSGTMSAAAEVTVVSLVRGAWEVRLVKVDPLDVTPDPSGLRLRIGGWPIAASTVTERLTDHGAEVVTATPPRGSRLEVLRGVAEPGTVHRHDASPLGVEAEVPYLTFGVRPGEWVAALLELRGSHEIAQATVPAVELETTPSPRVRCRATWPDGVTTTIDLSSEATTPVAP